MHFLAANEEETIGFTLNSDWLGMWREISQPNAAPGEILGFKSKPLDGGTIKCFQLLDKLTLNANLH